MKLIPLTQGKHAMVDDSDYEYLMQWKWCAWTYDKGKHFYAKRAMSVNGKYVHVLMHSAIFGSKQVDHKDRNGLNNQRENLRQSDKQTNGFNRGPNEGNRSGFKGVSWHKRDSVWRARIHIGGKEKHLGFFHSVIEAARAFDAAALKLHGEFACTNQTLGLI